MAKMVTMREIAERAGVSVPTVSRILRAETLDRYREETQKRVYKAAEDLGWRPNLLVNGIRKNRSYTVGVMVPPFDTHWIDVLYGIHDELLSKGYVPLALFPKEYHDVPDIKDYEEKGSARQIVSRVQHMPRNEMERLYCFVDRRVDGIITFPLLEKESREYAVKLAKEGLPVVTLDQQLAEVRNPLAIEVNENKAMVLLINHLISTGRRHLMFTGRRDEITWACRRRKAFHRNTPAGITSTDLTVDDHYDNLPGALYDALSKNSGIDAIVCDTDHCAGRVIYLLKKQGLQVPKDIAVTGYGNIRFELFSLGITTIDQKPGEIGRLAAESIMAMCDGRNLPRHLLIEPSLIIRDSTGK
jgi:DNA-binding LacI/PurR family transcriptional regulator